MLNNLFAKNRYNDINNWTDVVSIFPKIGRQGVCGILSTKDKKHEFVFKVSQYIDSLIQHEYTIMKGLDSLSFCPNFCKSIGYLTQKIKPRCITKDLFTKSEDDYMIESDVLCMEYIRDSNKFAKYIKSSSVSDDVVYSIMKQTLLAIAIAQKKKQFTHYDLHSDNVMVRKCDKNLVFLYVMDEKNVFCVPSFGHYPVIIDYGFSYSSDLNNKNLISCLSFTNIGFYSDRFDSIADPKLFTISVCMEIKENRKTGRNLISAVKENYKCLSPDWKTGWDKNELSASDYVLSHFQKIKISKLFREYDNYCIDIIQKLIVLPIRERQIIDLEESYTMFLIEFEKIEKQVGSPFFCMYILQGIVNSAIEIRGEYDFTNGKIQVGETNLTTFSTKKPFANAKEYVFTDVKENKSQNSDCISIFQVSVYNVIDSVSKYVKTDKIDFEKLFVSLISIANNIEGLYHKFLTKSWKKKQKLYSNVKYGSPEQVYCMVEDVVPDNYVFNTKTEICVINCMNNSQKLAKLNKTQTTLINEIHPLSRGMEIYNMLSNIGFKKS